RQTRRRRRSQPGASDGHPSRITVCVPGRRVDVGWFVDGARCRRLVGRSGAGKSTVATLIARLYEPSAGCIFIDGIDARRYRLKSLREQIAVVLQDSVLLSGTIADNIRYGKLDASERDVVIAACAAHVEEFLAD